MRAALRVVRTVITVLLGLVVLINVALLFSRFVLKQEPPQIFGFYPMVVTTGSMEPTLPAGSVVITHAGEDFDVGDIISFRRDGAVVTHQVIERTAEGYRTAGVANNTPDSGAVPEDAVLGKVVLCLPAVGRIILVLRGPIGILALAAVGGALLFLPTRRERKHEDTEK